MAVAGSNFESTDYIGSLKRTAFEMKNTIYALISVLFLVSASSFAGDPVDPCPRMAGRYSCPKTPDQDELEFEVFQTRVGKKMRYIFRYAGFPDDIAEASPYGVLNRYPHGDQFIFCVDHSLIYVKRQNDSGTLQQSFRGSRGEYVVKVSGKEVIRCNRTK